MKRLDQLTFTRFLAALAVVFFHSGSVWPANVFPFNPLLTSGQTAVSYFYVLSGFVMSLVYYRPLQRFDYGAYFKARFSRIYPVYLLAFLLTCLYYIDIMATVKTQKILANLLLIQAWNPVYALSFNIAAWSLSVEAFFYLIFPFIALWAARLPLRRLIGISIGFWVLSQVIHAGLYQAFYPVQHNLLLYFPLVHLNSFLLGVVGGIWFLSEAAQGRLNQITNRWLLILSLGLAGMLVIARERLPVVSESFSLDAGLLAPFFLVIVLALALDKTNLAKLLSHPRLVLLGDSSYALYILHVPIRWIGERWVAVLKIPYSVFIYIFWIVVVALSVFVFVRLERPARDWLRRNFSAVRLMLLDIAIILLAIYLGFVLQLGTGKALRPYADTLRLMLRVAVPAYGLGFMWFHLYGAPPKGHSVANLLRCILPATAVGGTLVAGTMLLASHAGWVEGFSRLAILISAFLVAVLTFLVRLAIQRSAARRL